MDEGARLGVDDHAVTLRGTLHGGQEDAEYGATRLRISGWPPRGTRVDVLGEAPNWGHVGALLVGLTTDAVSAGSLGTGRRFDREGRLR